MTAINVRVYREESLIHPGYGRWFYEITRDGRVIKTGGGHCEEQRVRRELSSFARHSNMRGEEAYAVDCAAFPTYPGGKPRSPWAELGGVERWSWEKRDAS